MSATPSAQTLRTRVDKLSALIADSAEQGERDRRIPEEVMSALTGAGIFRLSQPRTYGGCQASARTMLELSAAVAEADGGTGWVVALCNVCSWLVGLFPERAQDEVWKDSPDARVVGALAPTAESRRVEGGHEVTGRWYWTSGSWHADWAVLGTPITDESGAVVDQGLALVPRADLHLEDTWFAAGMRSTASNCFVARDVFVPEHRVLSVPAAVKGSHPGTDQAPLAFGPLLALVLAAPQLGLGRKALALVTSAAATKPVSYTYYTAQADSVAFQLQIAEAAVLIDTAQLHAFRAADDLDRTAEAGDHPDLLARARVRADTARAVQCIGQAIDILMSAHGAGSFADANPLQRIWRDSAVAARHALTIPAVNYEIYGKALLGRQDQISPLI
ncbi:acyl-CoA dehydrogenase family protein [Kribbella sp. NPDC055071]